MMLGYKKMDQELQAVEISSEVDHVELAADDCFSIFKEFGLDEYKSIFVSRWTFVPIYSLLPTASGVVGKGLFHSSNTVQVLNDHILRTYLFGEIMQYSQHEKYSGVDTSYT